MARYIDVKKLLKDLTSTPDGTKIPDVDCDNFPVKIDLRLLKRIILRQPAADVVEVVRCKDCKHKEKETNKWCKFWNKFCAYDDNYCSYGERRDT